MHGLWARASEKSVIGGFIDIYLPELNKCSVGMPKLQHHQNVVSDSAPTTTQTSTETHDDQQQLLADGISVSLTHSPLNIPFIIASVKSPKAGAIVLFAGTTRDSFANKPVLQLQYTAYPPLALRSMLSIAQSIKEEHNLTAISLVHRLGVVPIAEESILIAVSAPHRQAAWRAGEEALERVKEKVEIWKLEEFQGEQGGVWRANRDGQGGVCVG